MPLTASLAAATRKAAVASALAARERVKAGLPINEDTFYPPSDQGALRQKTPTPQPQAQQPPQPQPPQPQPKAQSPARGQQAAAGARVLQPRGATHAK